MSYSRWIESAWQVHSLSDGNVSCGYSVEVGYVWNPKENSLDDFIAIVRETASENGVMPNEVDELKNILKDNINDIMGNLKSKVQKQSMP